MCSFKEKVFVRRPESCGQGINVTGPSFVWRRRQGEKRSPSLPVGPLSPSGRSLAGTETFQLAGSRAFPALAACDHRWKALLRPLRGTGPQPRGSAAPAGGPRSRVSLIASDRVSQARSPSAEPEAARQPRSNPDPPSPARQAERAAGRSCPPAQPAPAAPGLPRCAFGA